MSTLEKLLVLGVLILVGVILSISLFWSRTENGVLLGDLGKAPNENTGAMPTRSTLDPAADARANPNNPAGGGADLNGGSVITAAPTASQPVRSPLLSSTSRVAPSPLLLATANPDLWNYRVRQGDTPTVVSKKLTGESKYAAVISRANEDRPFVPGRDILVPNEVFQGGTARPAAVELGGDPFERNVTEVVPVEHGTIQTGPGANAKKSAVAEGTPKDAGAPAPAPASGDAAFTTYVVKRGESLRSIARTQLKDERRWQELRDVNGLKNDVIRAGQRLKLPK